jgi:predicted molibdopterin-dependent oxidoreductase YjgC
VAVQRRGAGRHADHARSQFVRGKGRFMVTEYVATDERTTRKFPLILTTGRILSQYNVGAQTRRTQNNTWHDADVLEIHPHDAEQRGIRTASSCRCRAARARPRCAPVVTERMQPGVVYTTFHHPESGANVVTTENSDWATNCPEYKVTAVQVAKGVEAHAFGAVDVWSPNSEAFQPPKLWKAIGTGIGTLTPTMPTCTRRCEVARGVAVAGEDRGAVAVLVLVDQRSASS